MKNFKALKVWQKGFAIAVKSFHVTREFPEEERFGLALQITRAATSIPSKIAEGSSRSSEKDYNRFLEIALGSACELETQMLLALSLQIGNENLIKEVLSDLEELQRMLTSFMNKLNK